MIKIKNKRVAKTDKSKFELYEVIRHRKIEITEKRLEL